ncbi:MAG: DASH family cryptochrome [Halobacteriales archaeon]
MTDTALLWFRSDLRLHDNEALVRAAGADELLPVYIFDPHWFGRAEFGGSRSFRYEKTGGHRTRFLRESVADLRSSLRARGSDLVVRRGDSAEELAELADEHGVEAAYFHTYPTSEEEAIEAGVVDALRERDVETTALWGHTLHHPDDLPRPVADIDDTFTPFKDRVEAKSTVRGPREIPSIPTLLGKIDPGSPAVGDIPGFDDLGVDPPERDDRGVLDFEGGETRGLERVEEYVWERDRLRSYRETRNGLLGADYSSKLSAWLNAGCLSPRRVHAGVQEYERERVANDSTYWLLFELRWRDFYAFQFAKHGDRFFAPGGIRERSIDWNYDEAAFRRWAEGETGIPFVDANMRELNATGYMSNRGRQNAASFLANDLRIDWRIGAAYFETQLVDYDVASNYGNWAYVAGVGNDSRDRAFDVVSQGRRYDADAEYVAHWLPVLDGLPPEYAREPWRLSDGEMASHGVERGVDYPEPMVEPSALEH